MNEEKFTGRADVYERFRPSYPDALIDFLYENAKCDNVCDIGAGTGKFTRCLLKKPWKITAVESNDDMRRKLSDIAGITVINASAENTGLCENSFGLVTAAQAFHWFDEEKFKAECKRILTENGKAAFVWNDYIEEGLAEQQTIICRKYSRDRQYAEKGHTGVRSTEAGEEFFREYFDQLDYKTFFSERVLDLETFIGEALSRSHAPKEGEDCYEPFVEEMKNAFASYEKGGRAAVRSKTSCFFGSF